MKTLTDTQKLADLGWPVHPLKPGGKTPLLRHGVKDASTNHDVISGWFDRWPDANVGVATGGPILVVDIDPRHGGNESLAALPELPTTVEAVTGGGGRHFYFANPGGIGNRADIKPGIDIRCDGGYVVAPPSKTDKPYTWTRSPWECELAAVPDWLLELIRRPAPAVFSSAAVSVPGDADAALKSMRRVRTKDGNDGSKRLFAYACRAREHNLSAEQFVALVSVLITEKPFPKTWSKEEIIRRWTDAAKRVEIGSALNKGPSIRDPEGRTDTANGKRLAIMFRDRIRWDGRNRIWLIWNGRYWEADKDTRIEALAKQVAEMIWHEARSVLDDKSADEKLRKAVASFAKASSGGPGITNMVRMARSEPGIAVDPKQFDQNRYLLNCENGTLDLRTGTLREHLRDDYISRMIPVAYDPAATAPIWLAFLNKIFDDKQSLIRFLARFLGYCLTGDVSEQVLAIFHGSGANGKSTLINVLCNLLGDYAGKCAPQLLTAKSLNGHPTELKALSGLRVAIANENEDGARFAESRVKELTGGEKINARGMHEDFAEFEPTFKLIISTNYEPEVYGSDHGIWRRLLKVPFNVTVAEAERDKHLGDKLKGELPGVLAWMVTGCLEWQANGLGVPPEVKKATDEYRESQDVMAGFIAECCETRPDWRENASVLIDRFKAFSGHDVSAKRFAKQLKAKGFKNDARDGNGRIVWTGLQLKA